MIKPNTHKFIYKNKDNISCNPNDKNVINVSRSIGNSGYWIGCGFIEKTSETGSHINFQIPFFSLVYVINGTGEYIDENGKVYPLKEGSLFQRRPNIVHSSTVAPGVPWHEYYIDLNAEFYNQLSAIRIIDRNCPVYQLSQNPSLKKRFGEMMTLLEHSYETELPDTAINFLSFVRNLVNLEFTSDSDQRIRKIIKRSCFDFNQLFDQRIDMREYCRANGWGYESFRKTFKRKIGLSPNRYIVQRRLDRASLLLKSTNQSISKISVALGYKSQYEFSNQFKKQFGVFPKQFREGLVT